MDPITGMLGAIGGAAQPAAAGAAAAGTGGLLSSIGKAAPTAMAAGSLLTPDKRLSQMLGLGSLLTGGMQSLMPQQSPMTNSQDIINRAGAAGATGAKVQPMPTTSQMIPAQQQSAATQGGNLFDIRNALSGMASWGGQRPGAMSPQAGQQYLSSEFGMPATVMPFYPNDQQATEDWIFRTSLALALDPEGYKKNNALGSGYWLR